MRISDWSSDVCSSDLRTRDPPYLPAVSKAGRCWRSLNRSLLAQVRMSADCRCHRDHGSIEYSMRLLVRTSGPIPAQWCLLSRPRPRWHNAHRPDRRSEEHTSELQSLMRISYAVFCLKKKKHRKRTNQE